MFKVWLNDTPIHTGYVREEYLKKILPYVGNRLIKVIIGQRRAGKSYLMRQIIQKLLQQKVNPKNIFYLNKEISVFDHIQDFQDVQKLLNYTKKELKIQGKMYILFDEVQEITGREKIVNSLSQDYKEEYEVFITGSNSTMLSGSCLRF